MLRVNYKEQIKKILSLDDPPEKIALSFAVGVFISISPFFGFHTILALVFSFLFRLNKVATITGSWMNNPWTVAPVYYIDYKIGSVIMGHDVDFNLKPFTFHHYLSGGKMVFFDILVGSIIFGTFVSTLTYFVLKAILKRRRNHVSNQG